ncbi:MAG: hypothetical protein ABJH68_05025 [Ilumatobacter sp.]|uniref:hypothetical protein n=1 Tax=Ilumatobacter sp. TaxID=1967498 RepID=UPI0032984F15
MTEPTDTSSDDTPAFLELPHDGRADSITIATRSDGVVAVQGPVDAVERFAERARRLIGSPNFSQATQYASTIASSIDVIPGVGEDERPRVFQFSQRALELLRENRLIEAGDGLFRGALGDGRVLPATIDWQPAVGGADLIQLQTAAVGLALHASIKNLADAVERVENRVDELRDLVRAGQAGEVLGHHRVIRERLAMIEDPNGSGLGQTDWSAVAHLHPHIVSGLERTRFFIRSRMGLTDPGRMVRSRVDAAERLVDANLADALGLLATTEYNLVGWQRLRLDRVTRTEPGHLDAVLVDMESSLDMHRREDQALVDDLADLIERLMEPTGLEGLELLQRRRLIRHVETIHSATSTFARQRDLRMPPILNVRLPGFRDSTGLLADKTLEGGRWAIDKVKRGGGTAARALPRGRRRRAQPAPPDPATRSPID